MTEKRISPKRVLQSFQTLGIKAGEGEYFSHSKNCACGLGAIYIMENYKNVNDFVTNEGEDSDYESIYDYFDNNYSTDYHLGFVHGFDGTKKLKELYDREPYTLGYEDGRKSREICQEAGIYI